MSVNTPEHWRIVRIIREDSPDVQNIREDEYDEKEKIEYVLQYLSEKQHLSRYDNDEELVFFPELYGICPSFRHNNCLHLRKNRELLEKVEGYIKRTTRPDKRTPILSYIHEYNFVEIYLDNLQLKNPLPKKIFSCKNLRILSLKGNHLRSFPADVGRLKNLEELYLSNNKLRANSLPYTLTFCYKLHTLFLDNNKMVALPGFLLKMKHLFTLRRQSTKTSFRKMFIIQRATRIEKIQPLEEKSAATPRVVTSLQNLAAKVIIASKIDYFSIQYFPTMVQDVVSRYYPECTICENCTSAEFEDAGYFVSTSRYGYLGNYWSVFLHQACSKNCAEELHKASYEQEQSSLGQLNDEYNKVVNSSQVGLRQTKKNNQCCVIS
ncbi:leucine-rich repeat-containing protein 58-like [Planococcus citri]|uniref:leucine-rich repeat-containing protein 58-like n=1 Tax=Planococcus citri TaxID=170843 RepID=UPI0031F8A2FE